jgi:bacillolysin
MTGSLKELLIITGSLLFTTGTGNASVARVSTDNSVSCEVQTIYAGKRIITCYKNDSCYLLRDMAKGHGIITLHGDQSGKVDYKSYSANWKLTGKDAFAVEAHFGVSETYRFYKAMFNRSSLDDHDMAIVSYVNDPANPNNAVWDGAEMRFGINLSTGKPVCSLDVTGHELTHAVISFTVRLAPGNESGAINESICDIMGKSIEHWSKKGLKSWCIGADAGLNLRDMSEPHRFLQPAAYKESAYWYKGHNHEMNDHINSGVGNRMFYLLVTGDEGQRSDGNVYNIRRLNWLDADRIIYYSFTKYMNRYADYSDWRRACLQAAAELFGQASYQYYSVAAAWTAVDVVN